MNLLAMTVGFVAIFGLILRLEYSILRHVHWFYGVNSHVLFYVDFCVFLCERVCMVYGGW